MRISIPMKAATHADQRCSTAQQQVGCKLSHGADQLGLQSKQLPFKKRKTASTELCVGGGTFILAAFNTVGDINRFPVKTDGCHHLPEQCILFLSPDGYNRVVCSPTTVSYNKKQGGRTSLPGYHRPATCATAPADGKLPSNGCQLPGRRGGRGGALGNRGRFFSSPCPTHRRWRRSSLFLRRTSKQVSIGRVAGNTNFLVKGKQVAHLEDQPAQCRSINHCSGIPVVLSTVFPFFC